MNTIENVWQLLADEVYKNGWQYNNQGEFKEAIEAAWPRQT